nr:hypothetical protein CFP56_59210 [Quercus suber]
MVVLGNASLNVGLPGAGASLGASPKLRQCDAGIVVAGASLQATLGLSRSSDNPSVSEAMLRPRRSQHCCRGRCIASATLGSSRSSNAPAATIPASLNRRSSRNDPSVAVEAGASLQRRWDRRDPATLRPRRSQHRCRGQSVTGSSL